MARNPAAFTRYVHHPYMLRTVDGTAEYKTAAHTHHAIETYVDALRARGMTDINRVCDTAQFVAPDHISGYHTTRVICGDDLDLAPFLTRMSLYRTNGLWQVAVSDTSLRTADWQILPDWFDAHGDIATSSPCTAADQRAHLFQSILDRISVAFLSGDINGWLQSVSLPLQLVTRQGIETFETEASVRHDFELYQQEFAIHGVTDIIREAKTAELIDTDQMVGTYRTHILRGANHVVPPWDASMTLRRENRLWRVTTVMRAIGHLNWSAIDPITPFDTPTNTPHETGTTTPKKGDLQ
ncbi:MAG: hypothetical protein AAF307_08160 [Pseudomonadota bacterium]